MPAQLTREMIEFIESGVSMCVGSRDDDLRPEVARALGATVSADGATVSFYLQAPLAVKMRENLAKNGLVAVTFSRILDHRTIQLKGSVRSLRAATAADEADAHRYMTAFGEQLLLTGLPRSVVRRVRVSPGLVVTFAPTDIFVQTPGPGAGRRMEGAG